MSETDSDISGLGWMVLQLKETENFKMWWFMAGK